MRHWRGACLLVAFVVLSGALWGALKAFREAEGIVAFARLADHHYLADIETLRQQGKLAEALALSQFVCDQPTYPQQSQACELIEPLRADMHSAWYRVRSFGRGALSGTAVNGWALAGATTADFFIVGDIRDIAVQGWRMSRGQEVDELLMALSAVGIATVAMPSLDWGLSFSKMAVRLGVVSQRFTRHLLGLTRRAVMTGRLIPLQRLFRGMHRLMLHLGPAKTLGILPVVDHAEDVSTIARLVHKRPHQTYALLKVGGRDALRTLANTGAETTTDLLRAARKGAAGLRLFQRFGRRMFSSHLLVGAGKALHRGRLPQAVSLWLAAQTPALRFILTVLLATAWLLVLIGLWHRYHTCHRGRRRVLRGGSRAG